MQCEQCGSKDSFAQRKASGSAMFPGAFLICLFGIGKKDLICKKHLTRSGFYGIMLMSK